MGEQAALAHTQLGCQSPDAEAVKSVDRGDVGGGPEDVLSGAGSLGGVASWHAPHCIARTSVLF